MFIQRCIHLYWMICNNLNRNIFFTSIGRYLHLDYEIGSKIYTNKTISLQFYSSPCEKKIKWTWLNLYDWVKSISIKMQKHFVHIDDKQTSHFYPLYYGLSCWPCWRIHRLCIRKTLIKFIHYITFVLEENLYKD